MGGEALAEHTEVIIIGNGPAAISLSTFLSGWHPFYNSEHPDPTIHSHLSPNQRLSLFDQNLSWFFDYGIADRINPSVNPYGCFYDLLVRPRTIDFPNNSSSQPCSSSSTCESTKVLRFRYLPERVIPHVVLGDRGIGGSWTSFDDQMVTLSMADWMHLPGATIHWPSIGYIKSGPFSTRLPASAFKRYMVAYTKVMKTYPNFQPHTLVTDITKCVDEATGKQYWRVRGRRGSDDPFVFTCSKIVLASGKGQPRKLNVTGESQSSNVVYDLPSLKLFISTGSPKLRPSFSDGSSTPESEQLESEPVVIVGDGLSAADAILYCLKKQIPVVHIIKRSEKQLNNLIISKVANSAYPEYMRIFQLMKGKQEEPNYKCLHSTNIVGINGSELALKFANGDAQSSKFSCLAVCIGRESELSMLGGKTFEFMANNQCSTEPTMFRIGSLAGDHFVRYIIGGVFQVAQAIINERIGGKGAEPTEEVANICNFEGISQAPIFHNQENGCEIDANPNTRIVAQKPIVRTNSAIFFNPNLPPEKALHVPRNPRSLIDRWAARAHEKEKQLDESFSGNLMVSSGNRIRSLFIRQNETIQHHCSCPYFCGMVSELWKEKRKLFKKCPIPQIADRNFES